MPGNSAWPSWSSDLRLPQGGRVNNHSPLQRALISPSLVAKKGQEKDNNWCFYVHRSFILIRKVNAVNKSQKKGQEKNNSWTEITTSRFYIRQSSLEIRSSTALKFLTIVDSRTKDWWTGPETTALSRSLKRLKDSQQENWMFLMLLYAINKLIVRTRRPTPRRDC